VNRLFKRFNQLLNLSQSGCQCRAAIGIGCSLRKDVFALKVERLSLPLGCGAFFGGEAPFFFTHWNLSGTRRFLLGGVRHLLFHRFTFPTAGHIFILRAKSKRRTTLGLASNQI